MRLGLPRHYILNPDHSIRPCGLMEWAEFFEDISNRRVALTVIAPGISVSTVFMGMDMNFSDVGPPLVFETMSFDEISDGICERWATWNEAAAGHDRIVAEIRARLGIKDKTPLPESFAKH